MGRPKKVITETVIENKTNTTTNSNDEVSALKKQLEAMQKIMESLMKPTSGVVTETVVEKKVPTRNSFSDSQVKINPPFGQFINVISLTNGILGLKTAKQGGTEYHFHDIGEMQSILYDDIAKIIHENKSFAEGGNFYILNEDVIKLHNLGKHYEKFITAENILDILEFDLDSIEELIISTTNTIKETIVSVVREKLLEGHKVDLNKVNLISELCDEDIMTQIRNINEIKENMKN